MRFVFESRIPFVFEGKVLCLPTCRAIGEPRRADVLSKSAVCKYTIIGARRSFGRPQLREMLFLERARPMIKKYFARFFCFHAVAFIALFFSGYAKAGPVLDNVTKVLGDQAKEVRVEITKWKASTKYDPRCLDPDFVPDKSWKLAKKGYSYQPGGEGAWF